jgi:hypothetical protein
MSITQYWADVEETAGQSSCPWDHCLLDLREQIESLQSEVSHARTQILRLSNACAKLAPNRNEFLGSLIPDYDTDPDQTAREIMETISAALLEAGHEHASDWLNSQIQQ